MSEFILLKSYFHKHDAQIAIGLLNDSGIEAILQSDDAGGFRPHLTFSMGNNRILVHKKDAKKAMEVIKTLDDDFTNEEIEQLEEIAVTKKLDTPKKEKSKPRNDYSLWIPFLIAGMFLFMYVMKETHKPAASNFKWRAPDTDQSNPSKKQIIQDYAKGITQVQAQSAAVAFLKNNNLNWGSPSRVRNTVGVSPKGNKWYAIEFDDAPTQPNFVLVNPDTAEVEFSKPR